VVGVLGVLAVASRQSVRENVGTWWRTKAASTEPIIFPRDREKGGGSGGSSNSGSSPNEPASPPPPSHPESQRLGPPGEPNNTRVGGATPQGSASGNSSNGSNSGGGRTFDIFPKTAPAQTRKDESSSSASGSSGGAASNRSGAVAPKNTGSDRQRDREADATPPAPINVTGVLTVSTKGDGFGVVVIDGQSQGRTPLTWRGSVGRHTVTLRGVEDYSPRSTTVNVSARDTARITFTIKQP